MHEESFKGDDLFESLLLEILRVLKFDVFLYNREEHVYVISFCYHNFVRAFEVEDFLLLLELVYFE